MLLKSKITIRIFFFSLRVAGQWVRQRVTQNGKPWNPSVKTLQSPFSAYWGIVCRLMTLNAAFASFWERIKWKWYIHLLPRVRFEPTNRQCCTSHHDGPFIFFIKVVVIFWQNTKSEELLFIWRMVKPNVSLCLIIIVNCLH